ncbi:ATP-dependent helicase [Candidatus Saccharibacteria bacterium]|nr:ATP-dependent helicase [Candidatus Saccharibacteria bacterium]MBP9132286.1 ATP-dependent helicase [Candidatus Saccharibacteria bacterium]
MQTKQTDKINLNTQQKKAVDNIFGPLLVLAGPGTGKTQLLASRVANILQKTDTNASEILCLTFTDSAAINMRQRISKLIGSDAQKVTVHTFHGLGSEVINRYPEYFYHGADMQPSDEVVQTEIIENILQKLPHDNPLTKGIGSEFSQLNSIRSALDSIKKAGLSPGELREIIKQISIQLDEIEPAVCAMLNTKLSVSYIEELQDKIAELPDQSKLNLSVPFRSSTEVIAESLLVKILEAIEENKSKPVSNWRTKWLLKDENGNWAKFKERKKIDKWNALVDFYESYEQKMLEARRFDFADMIVQALHAIEDNPDLKADLQERWQYIMIDEFQDTNAAQLRLARLIADNPIHDNKPNIMVVGDDDQGIFKFQGAELDNISHFLRAYESAEVVVLKENYRSHADIIDYSRQLITQADDRLETRIKTVEKLLTQGNGSIKSSDIKRLAFETELAEHAWVAEDIKKRIDSGHKASEITVIARGHRQLKEIAKYLQDAKVELAYDKRTDVLSNPAVAQLVLMLRLVDALARGNKDIANGLIGEVLSHPMWQLDHKELWSWASQSRHQLVDTAVGLEEEASIRQITEWLLRVSQFAGHESLEQVIDVLVGSTNLSEEEEFYSPFKHYFFKANDLSDLSAEYLTSLSALRVLRGKLREYASSERLLVKDFVKYLEVLERTNTKISDESSFVTNSEAVQLLTAHKAKGLEFESVYIIGSQEAVWAKPNNRSNQYLQSLPIGPAGDVLDDYIRLVFVAITRAKKRLIMTAFLKTESGKDSEPLLMLGGAETFTQTDAPEKTASELLELSWQDYHPLPAAGDKVLLKPLLDNYRMSVTHLLNFLNVADAGPKYWLLTNLLQFPQAKQSFMGYGTAIHRALEVGLNQFKKGSDVEASELQQFFELALQKEQLNKDDFERYLGQGRLHLELYHDQLISRWTKQDLAEMNFANQGASVGEAILGGKIDRIAFLPDKKLQVIDIKTGKALTSWGRNTGNDGMKTWKYKRQLGFYKVLVENSRDFAGKYKVSEGALEFTQPDEHDKLKFLSLEITDDDVDHIKKLIEAVWQRMQSLDLPDAESYGDDVAANKQFEEDLLL